MAKRTNSRGVAGGGINSNKRREVSVKTGQPAREMRPAGVSQIGSHMGTHATEGGGKTLTRSVEPVRGARMPGAMLGNESAKSAGQGPGAGRDVSRSGSQAQHGPPAGQPKPQGRPILEGFGPNYTGSGRG